MAETPTGSGRQTGLLVANPGTIAEMPMMAAGLARAGWLREYISPIPVYDAHVPSRLRRVLPLPVVRRLERELSRRLLPPALDKTSLGRTATLLELASLATYRMKSLAFAREPLINLRNAQFDRSVANRLRRGDAGLVSTYGAAFHSFTASRRMAVPAYLEYPIAHHRFAQRLLAKEAMLQPDYADTLQFHQFSSRKREQLESEIRIADRIFMLSTFHKQTFLEEGVPEQKLRLTPLGVDLEEFQPSYRRIDGDSFRVLFVGQITQRKGISYLIDAFKKLALPDGELILIGQVCGSDRSWASTPGIRHIPHVPRSRLAELYGTASAFVLPSIVEGFGLTALEAMACGLPVIVSENTFGTDIVDDGVDGYVVPIRQPEAIADRLRDLYKRPAAAIRMGLAARRKAERFSWSRYGERIVEVISSAASNRQTSYETTMR